jgi:non-specific serine/threonine protein kinase
MPSYVINKLKGLAVSWMNFFVGGILADDMGLGKKLYRCLYSFLQEQQNRDKNSVVNLVVLPTTLISTGKRKRQSSCPKLAICHRGGTRQKVNEH